MKTPVVALLSLLLLVLSARSYAAPQVADTLKGQKQFISHVSTEACRRFGEEEKKKPLNQLTAAERQTLFMQVIEGSMEAHSTELASLMTANKVRNQRKFSEGIGEDVVMALLRDCPVGQHLLASLGMAQMSEKLTTTAEEKPLLSTITADICQRLDAENAKMPLSSRSKAERGKIVEAAMQGGMFKHMEPLVNLYGLDALKNNAKLESLGEKIGFLMLEQCPSYLMLVGADASKKN